MIAAHKNLKPVKTISSMGHMRKEMAYCLNVKQDMNLIISNGQIFPKHGHCKTEMKQGYVLVLSLT